MSNEVMTKKQFCDCLGMSIATWYRLDEKPKHIQINGKSIRISREDAIAWFEERSKTL